jgi:hypothetical protein
MLHLPLQSNLAMVGLSGFHVDGKPMVRQPAAGRSVLVTALRWPWATPVLAVVAVSLAGQVGRTWWYMTLGGMAMAVALLARGLRRWGRGAPVKPAMWRDELLAQLDSYWENHLWPRLQGLTDEEYFWEPVSGCWSIRKQADGAWVVDGPVPAPDPSPVTTIGWRLAHLAVSTLGIRTTNTFGGSLMPESARWPASAAEALSELQKHYHRWYDSVRRLEDADLAASLSRGEQQRPDESLAALVLRVNQEVVRRGGEICLLRDLYRGGGMS